MRPPAATCRHEYEQKPGSTKDSHSGTFGKMRSLILTGAVVSVALLAGCGQSPSSGEPLGKQQQALSTGVVISSVYGSGAGATYKSDFVELFNRGATPVVLTGYTLQYSRQDFQTWSLPANKVTLTGTIPAGGYYLIKLSTGATGVDIPTADATGTSNFGTSTGLVALVSDATTLSCGAPPSTTLADGGIVRDPDAAATAMPCTSTSIVDLVGYGKAPAMPGPVVTYEGTGSAPTGSSITVLRRKADGCIETDDNNNDFESIAFSATVVPRNSASPLNLCGADAGLDAALDTAVVDVAVDVVDAKVDATPDAIPDATPDATPDAAADTGTAPTDTGTEEDTGSFTDTGSPPLPSDTGSSATDTGTAPALDEVTDDGGCGCRVAGGDRTSVAASLVGMFFALGVVARRRRR